MKLPIKAITRDRIYQTRVDGIDMSVVNDYIACLSRGDVFPPPIVFDVEGEYILVDGWHRVAALQVSGNSEIEVEVRVGTQEDALDYSRFTANKKNGLRLSSKDKRALTIALFADNRYKHLSTRELSDLVGCSHAFIAKVRKELFSDGKYENTEGKVKEEKRQNYTYQGLCARLTFFHKKLSEVGVENMSPDQLDEISNRLSELSHIVQTEKESKHKL